MSQAQMMWYAHIINEDKHEEYKYNLGLTEYLASFWNSEAVQKVRAQREMTEDERFATDKEFEQILEEKEYIEADKFVQSIKDKYKNTNLPGNGRERSRVVRSPEDLSGLFKITKKR